MTFIIILFPAFAEELREDKAMTHYNWGNEFVGNAEYALAILEYTGAIALMPDYFRAYYRRGNAYYLSGDHKKAIADYDAAIKLSPGYAEAYYNRAIAYFNRGETNKSINDIKKSIEDWETVLRIEPDNAQAKEYLEMARKLLEQMQTPPVVQKPAAPPPPPPPRLNITIYNHSNDKTVKTEFYTPNPDVIIESVPPGNNK